MGHLGYTSAMADSEPLLRLAVIAGPLSGMVTPWDDREPEFVLGRDGNSDLEIPDLTVSRRHCRLVRSGRGIELEDLRSGNGTYCNGVRLEGRCAIEVGAEFVLGATRVRLVSVPRNPVARPVPVRVEGGPGGVNEATITAVFEPKQAEPSWPASFKDGSGDLQSVLEGAAGLADALSLPELAEAVCAACFRIIPASRAALLIDNGPPRLAWGWLREGAAMQLPVSQTVIDFVQANGSALVSNDPSQHQRLAPSQSLSSQAVRRLIAVPLQAHSSSLGLLYLDRVDDSVEFTQAHVRCATALARITALAIASLKQREKLERENRFLRAEMQAGAQIVGSAPAMRDLFEKMTRIAPVNMNVLILGETGTGKELVARALHSGSPRWSGPFVAVNCATLSETLFESEMFGHERGAFTGAVSQRKGKFELAYGGTLFLDELGELAPALQAHLLRVLQERIIERVGGTRTIPVDVRVIAATNRDVEGLARQGEFRADLYQRLNVLKLRVPSLRERKEDIPALSNYFLQRCSSHAMRPIRGISAEALELFGQYSWPGNVRELQNTIERAVILGGEEWIVPDDLPEEILGTAASSDSETSLTPDWSREARRRALLEAFEFSGCSYTDTATALGMLPNNLHRLVTKLGLRDQFRALQAKAGHSSSRRAGA